MFNIKRLVERLYRLLITNSRFVIKFQKFGTIIKVVVAGEFTSQASCMLNGRRLQFLIIFTMFVITISK